MGRNPCVAHVRAGKITSDLYSIGKNCRQILCRMHGHFDIAREQGKVELLGKKPLAAGFAQRQVKNHVAAGFYGDDLDGTRRAMRRFEAIFQLARLGQRQGAAPRPKSEGKSFAQSRCGGIGAFPIGSNGSISGRLKRLAANAKFWPPKVQG